MRPREKYLTVTIIIVIMMITGAAFFFFFMPEIKAIDELQTEVNALITQLSEARKRMDKINTLRAELQQLSAEILALESRYVKEEDLLPAINELAEIAKSKGIEVLDIQPPDISLIQNRNVKKLPVNLMFRGRFLTIGRFLEELKDFRYFVTIEEIEIITEPDIYPEVLANVTLSLYRYLE